MKRIAFALVACFALGAQAESSVATLEKVVNSVSVGTEGVLVVGTNDMRLMEGSIVLISSKGHATVVLDNGCRVKLNGGEQYTVDSELSCVLAIASVKGGAAVSTSPLWAFGALGLGIVLSNGGDTKASGS